MVLAKFDKFEWELERRAEVAGNYLSLLTKILSVSLPVTRHDRSHVWAQFIIGLDNREAVAEALKRQGIPTAVHYPMPLHEQPAYKNTSRVSGPLVHSSDASERVLGLPMHAYLDVVTQNRIAEFIHAELQAIDQDVAAEPLSIAV